MSIVVLVSGGVDSSVISALSTKEHVETFPLFIDYGQRSAAIEWKTCKELHSLHNWSQPKRMRLGGFGSLVPSGLTDVSLDINKDAFLPCRNLLFLVCGAAYAYSKGASAVSIGLIDQESAIYPDQTRDFVKNAEHAIKTALGKDIRVVAPLLKISKAEVLTMAATLGIRGAYSCHAGRRKPCGICISCLERQRAGELNEEEHANGRRRRTRARLNT